MKLEKKLLQALARAVERCGSARELGRATGVDPANISRYLSGRVKSVSDDNWQKLRGVLETRETAGTWSPGGVIEWRELEKDPGLLLKNAGDVLALRVEDVQMAPRICDRDVIVVRPSAPLTVIPENKIVVAVCRKKEAARPRVVCKRLRNIGGSLWFFSDDPEGAFFPAEKENILWSGVVLRKICEL